VLASSKIMLPSRMRQIAFFINGPFQMS